MLVLFLIQLAENLVVVLVGGDGVQYEHPPLPSHNIPEVLALSLSVFDAMSSSRHALFSSRRHEVRFLCMLLPSADQTEKLLLPHGHILVRVFLLQNTLVDLLLLSQTSQSGRQWHS